MVSDDAKNEADRLVKSAEQKINSGKNMAGAVEDCTEALTYYPDYYLALCNLGIAKYHLGDNLSAIDNLQKAIKNAPVDSPLDDPSYPKASYFLGVAKVKVEDYAEAIPELLKGVGHPPEKPNAYYHLGICFASLGIYDDAIRYLQEAVDADNSNQQFKDYLQTVFQDRDNFENEQATLNVSQIISDERKKHQKSISLRDNWIYGLWVALFFSVGLSLYWHAIGLDIIGLPKPKILEPFAFFLRSLSITGAICGPIIYFIRIHSRNAEEAKVLEYDFSRMLLAERRIRAIHEFTPEQRAVLFQKLISEWISDGPVETLLRMKNRTTHSTDSFSAIDIVEKLPASLLRSGSGGSKKS